MEETGVEMDDVKDELFRLEGEGKTSMILAVNGKISGIIAVADSVKDNSEEAIRELKMPD